MARRILSATDYGFRKVIRVVMDDALPEWVHPIDGGLAHTSLTARGPAIVDPVTGETAPGPLDSSLQAGTQCHACRFNHDVREFTFTREELEIEDSPGSGTFRPKTNNELVTQIQLRLLSSPPPTAIDPITNQII